MGVGRTGSTGDDPKDRLGRGARQGLALDHLDLCQGWGVTLQAPDKVIQPRGLTPGVDHHALGVVPHLALQAEVLGQSPHGWAKAHTLDQADESAPQP